MPVSLVTPSTRPATSSPNCSRTSSRRGGRVLDGVVQQRGAQRLGVQPHAGADARDADRVRDEVLAGLAALVGVVLAGEQERLQDRLAVDRRGDLVRVLGDDREQVREQLVLERREVVAGCSTAPSSAVPAMSTGLCGAIATTDPSPSAVTGLAPSTEAPRSGRLSPHVRAGQKLSAVLKPSLVGHVGGRALERGALRVLGHLEGRPFAIEAGEPQLREDPHQAARECRGPRLRTLAPEQMLDRLTAARSGSRAVRGRRRSAGRGGRSPIRVFVEQSLVQTYPRPGGSIPRPTGPSVRVGGSSATTWTNGSASSGSSSSADHDVSAKPPTRSASDARPVRGVRGDREHRLAGGHEIAEQAGDPGAAQVARDARGR